MFTQEEIKIANATSRSNGASAINKDGSIRAIVPRYVAENINKEDSVLDFGAGKGAVHTKWLREQGFNATAYDFGDNLIEGLHDRNALNKQYKVIMASNVLNVQSSYVMLYELLLIATRENALNMHDNRHIMTYFASTFSSFLAALSVEQL